MPQLDGLRCLAALLVVAQHTVLTRYPLWEVFGAAIYAVWLFFVLSGFLITGILLRARDDAPLDFAGILRAFYARRALRIFPLYYAVIAVGAGMATGLAFRQHLGWYLAYAGNWFVAIRGDWDAMPAGPLWSLGVEEQFYLVWPALVLLTPRRWLGRVLASAIGVGVLSRTLIVLAHVNGGSPITAFAATPCNLDALALGALLAWHRHTAPGALIQQRRWTDGAALVAGVVTLATIFRGLLHLPLSIFVVLEPLAAALFAVWLVDRASIGFATASIPGRALGHPVVRYLGSISYGIYMLHGFVLMLFSRTRFSVPLASRADLPGALAYFALVATVTVAAASLSWYVFERPINRRKRHFPYPGTTVSDRAASAPVPVLADVMG